MNGDSARRSSRQWPIEFASASTEEYITILRFKSGYHRLFRGRRCRPRSHKELHLQELSEHPDKDKHVARFRRKLLPDLLELEAATDRIAEAEKCAPQRKVYC